MLRSLLKIGLNTGLLAVALNSQGATPAQLATPRVGLVRLQDGSVHQVLGLAGSFVVDSILFEASNSVSFSGQAGLVAFKDHLALLDENLQTVAEQPLDGAAVVSVTADAKTAVAWIAQSKTLLFWDGSAFRSKTFEEVPDGAVWSLRRNGMQAILLTENLQITLSLQTGLLVDCNAVAERPLEGFGHQTGQQASELTVEQMNDKYVHILSRMDGRTWVVSTSGESHVWELPAAKN